MRNHLLFYIVLFNALSGCASYKATQAPMPEPGNMMAWKTEQKVDVGVNPYISPKDQKQFFGANIKDKGILAIQVYLKNNGKRVMLARPSDMLLKLPQGKELTSARTSEVVSKLQKSGSFWGTFFFGFIGMMAAESSNDRANASMLSDFRNKEFHEVRLKNDDSTHGFIYFVIPEQHSDDPDATLLVRVVDAEEATSIVIKLPIKIADNKK
ncbi:MAG: hypothetical protein ACE5FZ_00540 [Nitrospiria bacterium]